MKVYIFTWENALSEKTLKKNNIFWTFEISRKWSSRVGASASLTFSCIEHMHFWQMSKIDFWACRVGESSIFHVFLKKTWKTRLIARRRFLKDVSANMEISLKIGSKQKLFLAQKWIPKWVRNRVIFQLIFQALFWEGIFGQGFNFRGMSHAKRTFWEVPFCNFEQKMGSKLEPKMNPKW